MEHYQVIFHYIEQNFIQTENVAARDLEHLYNIVQDRLSDNGGGDAIIKDCNGRLIEIL